MSKKRLSWSLRSLLVLVAIVSVVSAFIVGYKADQRAAIKALTAKGCNIRFHDEAPSAIARMLSFVLGEAATRRVKKVFCFEGLDTLEPLLCLTDIEELTLDNCPVSDIDDLAELKNLKSLWIEDCGKDLGFNHIPVQ